MRFPPHPPIIENDMRNDTREFFYIVRGPGCSGQGTTIGAAYKAMRTAWYGNNRVEPRAGAKQPILDDTRVDWSRLPVATKEEATAWCALYRENHDDYYSASYIDSVEREAETTGKVTPACMTTNGSLHVFVLGGLRLPGVIVREMWEC